MVCLQLAHGHEAMSPKELADKELRSGWRKMVLPSVTHQAKTDHSLLGGAVSRALKERCSSAEDYDELVQSIFHSAFHEVTPGL